LAATSTVLWRLCGSINPYAVEMVTVETPRSFTPRRRITVLFGDNPGTTSTNNSATSSKGDKSITT
jgi:hypothetical protein